MNDHALEAAHSADSAPGRSCPLHYIYSPRSLARDADLQAETIYVVGGLYGNSLALDALEELLAREHGPASVVFNGDFHWFDHEAQSFADICQRVLQHTAIRGNVETEFASSDDAAGCGCAYPEWVDDAIVERSNQIENTLRRTARQFPQYSAQIAALPMNCVAEVGSARIAIVHGDGTSLAGWGFSRRNLAKSEGRQRAADWLHTANVTAFACTHTCEALCTLIDMPNRQGLVINNGAAGMPNFHNTHYGLVTRISINKAGADLPRLYGEEIDGLYFDAIALHYDHDAWTQAFESLWPAGSPAHRSYAERINNGSDLDLDNAVMAKEPS